MDVVAGGHDACHVSLVELLNSLFGGWLELVVHHNDPDELEAIFYLDFVSLEVHGFLEG